MVKWAHKLGLKVRGRLSLAASENGLKMGRLIFPGHRAYLDFPETGALQPALQIALRKAEPPVAIGITRLLKPVLQQIEYQDMAMGA